MILPDSISALQKCVISVTTSADGKIANREQLVGSNSDTVPMAQGTHNCSSTQMVDGGEDGEQLKYAFVD
jgi:hypothetical protein